ncbi:MAG: hypothetical protein A2033_19355 [Bacteroidetes bacterium GWA2_31_9]|nr:MAG: hypothetical protein A2033_19355 [Bacteroidetes bacterium GWA2_31_9]
MNFSKYNIFSKIKDSDNYFIVNLLSGNADILEESEASKIKAITENHDYSSELAKELIDKGYVIDEKTEQIIYKNKYLDFIDNRETDEIQIFFVPNYSCNFACSYCYQDEYNNADAIYGNDVIDAFFNYITKEFLNRKKYITIFGGEPLLGSDKQKNTIKYLIQKATALNIDLSFVTNGYTLVDYIDILKFAKIREIQVTLDGTEKIHNSRRFLKGKKETFSKIVKGIDLCINNNITINLRAIIDKENINNLPELAKFAKEKGWTKNPYFKTQIGRNYELHHCQSSPDKLFSRVSLYENIYKLVKENPEILEFYKPSFSISKFLWENNELPDPLFDSCPACKTEWAFDYKGNIYSCTATVGKRDELLGTFYPEITLNQKLVNEWASRDVTEISECKSCNLQLACGGGCASISKNKTGKVCSPDCRPIKELLEFGFAQYF